jgi:predicted N-acetyltransferase YhbS
MYVKPSSRRQGIGSGLVTLALQKAKEASVPCFISAEPQARPLYLKLGFKDTEHFDIDLREYVPENCGFGVFRISGMINSS